jgi:hypothetical protein
MTVASSFAQSLGLSVHQQRIGFAIGVFLMLFGAALFLRGCLRERRAARDARGSSLGAEIEDELTAILDEWKALGRDQEVDHAAYTFLYEKTADFVRVVLGDSGRRRFERDGSYRTGAANPIVDLRIQALEHLCDHPETWRIQVDAAGLRRAVSTRKQLSYGEQLQIGESALARFYADALARPNYEEAGEP